MENVGTLLAVLVLTASANASDFDSIGYSKETTVIARNSAHCTGIYVQNCNATFENGYCWPPAGIVPPYYGASGESYDFGCVTVECIRLYLTQTGQYQGQPLDIYVWDGGISSKPGAIQTVVPGVVPSNVPFWPTIGENDFEVCLSVQGDFTVGYCYTYVCWYDCYIAVDEDGPSGHPWTNIAPGIGYPTGWQHPNVMWPGCVSLGIGFYMWTGFSPVNDGTWGAIKALFE